MSEQEKKYPKPEEVEAKDKIMYLANQWCKTEEVRIICSSEKKK